jgi:MarR family transcriptional regulator for hemolysin
VQPIGLQLARAARVVSQAFDRALSEAGGSAATWQVLLLIRSGQFGQQSEMAQAMGVTGATLTHHLNALERQGLVRRWREDTNRRVQRAELTADGAALFERLRTVAQAHDRRLRAKLTPGEREQLSALLEKISG